MNAIESKNEQTIKNIKKNKKKKSKNKNTSNMPKNHKNIRNYDFGQRGEDAACNYLKSKGYEIIYRNWKTADGEIDIVALEDDILVFIEVKTRSNLNCGLPEDAVGPKKRKKYEILAADFLKSHDYVDMGLRFDVIGILSCGEKKVMVRHHVNAFGAA